MPETGFQRAPGGQGKSVGERVNLVNGQFPRLRIGFGKADRAGSQSRPSALIFRDAGVTFPGARGARFSAGVRQLCGRYTALALHKTCDAFECGNVVVAPDAEILGRNAALRRNGCSLGKHHSCAADSAAGEVYEMPVAGKAVDTRVLAHGGYDNTIRQRHAANGKGIEKRGHQALIIFDAPSGVWVQAAKLNAYPSSKALLISRMRFLSADSSALLGFPKRAPPCG